VTQEGGACKFLIVALLDRGIYSMLWLMVGKFDVFWPRQNENAVARVALASDADFSGSETLSNSNAADPGPRLPR
jgi:hypothetical protein